MQESLKSLLQWPSNLDMKFTMYTAAKIKTTNTSVYTTKNHWGYANTTPFIQSIV